MSYPKTKGELPFSHLELDDLRQLTPYFPSGAVFTIGVDSANVLRRDYLTFPTVASAQDLSNALRAYDQKVAEKPPSPDELLISVGGIAVVAFLAFIRRLLGANVRLQEERDRLEADREQRKHQEARKRIREALARQQVKPSPEPPPREEERVKEEPRARPRVQPRRQAPPGATPFLDLRGLLFDFFLISMMRQAGTDERKPLEPLPQKPSEPIIEGQYRVVTDTDKPAEPPKALPPPSDTTNPSQ